MLLINFFLSVESHLIFQLTSHFMIVALQIRNAIQSFLLDLHLSFDSSEPVHLLLIIFLCLIFSCLFNTTLESESGYPQVLLNTFLTCLLFLILMTLWKTAYTCKKLGVIFNFTPALLDLFRVDRTQPTESTWSCFLCLGSVINVKSIWVRLFSKHSLALLCPWIICVDHLRSNTSICSLWLLDRWS